MPHLVIEYSSNIVEKSHITAVLSHCHHIIAETLTTDINTCKSRAYECNDYVVGDNAPTRAFIHLTLKIMPGRPEVDTLAKNILDYLKSYFQESIKIFQTQITMEIEEISKSYYKFAT